MKSILDNLRGLGRGRLIGLGVVGAFIIAAIIALSWASKPVYNALYSGLPAEEAAGIVRTLEQAGIQTNVSADGSIVSIPRGDFAKARMTLAENGMPSSGAPGWELFDEGGVGMNTYQQRVNRLRAIQGELARSIQTIEGVDAARVHVVLPEREAFSRERPTPTASIVIKTNAAFAFDKKHAVAIRHLVSSAVPNLAPNKVTVLTADGETLLGEDSDTVGVETGLESKKAAHEERLMRSLKDILSARFGAENVRVTATVDLTRETKTVVSEDYNPDQQVVRSTETSNESEQNRDGSADDVSVANNIPEGFIDNAGAGAGSTSQRQKNSEVINYEIGTTVSTTVYEPGKVERISVAVAVNGIYEEDANGDLAYTERTPQELSQLEELIKAAIGFQEARGDSVSVKSFQFREAPMDVDGYVSGGIGQFFEDNGMTLIKWALVALVITIIFAFGVRPVIAVLAPPQPEEEPEEEIDLDAVEVDAEEEQKPSILETIAPDEDDELIDISSVKGGVRKKRVAVVVDMVKNDKDEAVKILKTWVAQGA